MHEYYYTSCRMGLKGNPGLQIYNKSEDFDDSTELVAQRYGELLEAPLTGYYIPWFTITRRLFLSSKMTRGLNWLIHCKPVEKEYAGSGRIGYFLHAIGVTDQELFSVRPTISDMLWSDHSFKHELTKDEIEQDVPHKQPIPSRTLAQAFPRHALTNLSEVQSRITGDPNSKHLLDQIAVAAEGLFTRGKRVAIVERSDKDLCVLLALINLLPNPYVQRISTSTLVLNPSFLCDLNLIPAGSSALRDPSELGYILDPQELDAPLAMNEITMCFRQLLDWMMYEPSRHDLFTRCAFSFGCPPLD